MRFPGLKHGHKRLLGESVREIGVLLLVFVPLDGLLRAAAVGDPGPDNFSTPWLGWLNCIGKSNCAIYSFATLGVAMLIFGISMEHKAEAALADASGKD